MTDEEPKAAPNPRSGRERRSLPTHWKLLIAGALLDLVGSVLAFWGLTAFSDDPATGLPPWTGVGAVCIVAGMILVILAMRHKAEHG